MKLLEGLNKKDVLLTRKSDETIIACLGISGNITISRKTEDGDVDISSMNLDLINADDWGILRTREEYTKVCKILLKLDRILQSVNGVDSSYCPNVISEACYNTFGNISEKGYAPDDCYIAAIITPSSVMDLDIVDQYTDAEIMELANIFLENKKEIEEAAIKCLKNNTDCLYDIVNDLEEKIPF